MPGLELDEPFQSIISRGFSEFYKRIPEFGIRAVLLTDSAEETLLKPHSLAGIFPHMRQKGSTLFTHGLSEDSMKSTSIYSKILRLEVPQKYENIQVNGKEEMRMLEEEMSMLIENYAVQNLIPTAVLSFSRSEDKEEDVTALLFMPGKNPQDALAELKSEARLRIAALN